MRRVIGKAGLFLVLCCMAPLSAHACRGYQFWSTGEDPSKLKPGEIVVKAKLLEAYKSEQRFEHSIMGVQYGMIYHVEVSGMLGGTTGIATAANRDGNTRIFVRLKPSICEVYVPRNFTKDTQKLLVLKKDDDGVYDLVGGQE